MNLYGQVERSWSESSTFSLLPFSPERLGTSSILPRVNRWAPPAVHPLIIPTATQLRLIISHRRSLLSV